MQRAVVVVEAFESSDAQKVSERALEKPSLDYHG
jgi:hypothetical protein